MLKNLMPKTAPFFELLEEQNATLRRIAELTVSLFCDAGRRDELMEAIAKAENDGDLTERKIMRHLSQSFVTPIDREDILRICQTQEGCIDCLQHIAMRLTTFNLVEPLFPARQIIEKIKAMLDLTEQTLKGLRQRRDSHKTRSFHALREECDLLLTVGMGELLDSCESQDVGIGTVIKWVQIYDRLENALSSITDFSESLEEAVMKNV